MFIDISLLQNVTMMINPKNDSNKSHRITERLHSEVSFQSQPQLLSILALRLKSEKIELNKKISKHSSLSSSSFMRYVYVSHEVKFNI